MKGVIISRNYQSANRVNKILNRENISSLVYSYKAIESLGIPDVDFILVPFGLNNDEWGSITEVISNAQKELPIFIYGEKISSKYIKKIPKEISKKIIIQNKEFNHYEFIEIIKDYEHLSLEANIKWDNIEISLTERKVKYMGNEEYLSEKEYLLLKLLIQNANSVVSRIKIIENIWSDQNYVSNNTIDVYVSRLRKKLKHKKTMLRTIPKLGYELLTNR